MTVNSNRFLSPVINPAFLPRPDAIEALDEERLIAERMAEFQARADQAGFPYDVGGLEFDPIKIDQEAHAYRELLMRARVNSAVRAVLPAYAQGTDLEAIAARANVARAVVRPADPETGAGAVYEDDASLLLRYLTAFAVPAAGSEDGYIYRAVTAEPLLRDVAVLGPAVHGTPGRVDIFLLWEGGEPVPDEVMKKVRAAYRARGATPLTDWWVVSRAPVTPYRIELTITLPPGPAPTEVTNAAREAVRKVADARYAIGADVWLNAIEGAAYVANVKRVTRIEPGGPINPGPSGAAFCTEIVISAEIEP